MKLNKPLPKISFATRALSEFDRPYIERFGIVAGLDEVGRGPLAGPVVAAACIIEHGIVIEGVDDSKKLHAEERERLSDILCRHPQVCFAIAEASVEEINSLNILEATRLAMHRAIAALKVRPNALIVDGIHLEYGDLFSERVIGGDSKSQMCAGASIVGKVYRDKKMVQLAAQYPGYGFEQHKGYGTALHMAKLKELGPCAIHRNFIPCREAARGG